MRKITGLITLTGIYKSESENILNIFNIHLFTKVVSCQRVQKLRALNNKDERNQKERPARPPGDAGIQTCVTGCVLVTHGGRSPQLHSWERVPFRCIYLQNPEKGNTIWDVPYMSSN